MEIVGRGFLAGHLGRIAESHPRTVVIAAGVSWAACTSERDFARETALVDEVARTCKERGHRVVFFSTATSGIYGPDGPGREDDAVTPGSPYGAHKIALEERVRASGADHLVLRLGHVVGGGQPPHQLLPTLVRQIREGRVRVFGNASRDLIDVADTVTIVDRLLGLGLTGATVNVASGTAIPVPRLVDHLADRLGLAPEREDVAAGSHYVVSIERLKALVPDVAAMGFGPDYYRKVLDGYVEADITGAT
ncbi:NAD-dependent epimerase/dehydratase family protein [Actinomadura rayongensis]|uniref:NAD-dependent epimerase/dehydratase family protein n=1 Tax=Actinomadura rayongensis TaxID=1429076 RepID=A0A6I4W8G3_9ACTN|nr:NAD-dependent epimerase/dehydratase family protein [Actinomadura rayongensis]MXQ63032.1 NAD-dependent epimerase/dehydratase family protein [Actinomadura rayongensis]